MYVSSLSLFTYEDQEMEFNFQSFFCQFDFSDEFSKVTNKFVDSESKRRRESAKGKMNA